ncbi:hypothetical protein DCAR_0728892 [Daucus carota subsp. sativus]|uniref:O-acyltransferase WSD1 C-terminal domain-containing protein n=1 Tax=Daucus carota subsp. sativus TaxID=79200 RepID=A0AAF0XJT8_DAUCS|nr:hypothetical protein DCAR_0728892 [Daucus carota subsp. sativus]
MVEVVQEGCIINISSSAGNDTCLEVVPIPKLSHVGDSSDPLEFIREVHKTMDRKKKSSAVYMTSSLIKCVGKFRGPEVAAKLIHSTLKDSSIALPNLIGAVEQMAIQNHPVKGFYFTVAGVPVSTGFAIVSYIGKPRVAIASEKGYIDADKFKSCILEAFYIICKIIADVYRWFSGIYILIINMKTDFFAKIFPRREGQKDLT